LASSGGIIEAIISRYINEAMKRACYKLLPDQTCFGLAYGLMKIRSTGAARYCKKYWRSGCC
jgi:hypothetical protein